MKREAPKERGSALIGEMMLAKTVLEEKNEILDRKDERIRELSSRERRLESELAEMREQLEAAARGNDQEREAAYRRGIRKVAAEVALLALDGEDGSGGLSVRLIRLLERDYGMEIIDRVALPVDPRVHHVIEVVQSHEAVPHAEVLAKGIVLNGTPVRPALVRVFELGGGHWSGQG